MRRSLTKFASLLMALVILCSMIVPSAFAAESIRIPLSFKVPSSVTAVAGVEFDIILPDGLTYSKLEKSATFKNASNIDNVSNGVYAQTGVLKVGLFSGTNDYKAQNGVLDVGYLVLDGVAAGQELIIKKAKFVLSDPNNKDKTTTYVVENLTITVGASGDEETEDGTGSTGSGVIIDGSAVTPDVNIVDTGAGSGKTDFPFVDVKTGDWFYKEVKGAYQNGLINGKTATEYKPNDTLTTAEAIKLAAALHQLKNTGKVTLTNGTPNWYSSYVTYAVNNGIIEAKYQNYSLAQMNTAISRKEFVHIFHGAMTEYPAINSVADNAIPDVKLYDQFASDIYEFYRAGILVGSNGGYFKPNDNIKRSEVAAILVRMYDASVRQSITLG